LEDAQELLNTAGKVIPVTLTQTTICADLEDGSTLCGETNIDTRGNHNPHDLSPIKQLRLLPSDAPGCAQAIRAIRRADTIIIGPGDLYTSLLPNLLVSDITKAVRESRPQLPLTQPRLQLCKNTLHRLASHWMEAQSLDL